jgi:uncharacterized protein DUF3352
MRRRRFAPQVSFVHRCIATLVLTVFITACVFAQETAVDPSQNPFAQIQKKYPGLLEEFGHLAEAVQRGVQPPPPRSQSNLLPLLPDSTVFYLAIPNYGDASHQLLTIFQTRMKQSQVLRDWWHRGDLSTNGPKIESSLENFYQLSEFLGNEIVVSASAESKREPDFLILAEVRKSGLKTFLQQTAKEYAKDLGSTLRVLDVQDLATAKDSGREKTAILVRPDIVLAAANVSALRRFQARLEHPGRSLATTQFGQRIREAYDAGTSIVAAGDLHAILGQIPQDNSPNQALFEHSGFADMKYAVWEYRGALGPPATQMELSFTGPRHGIASWLAAPAPLGSLDFVSPKPAMAIALMLKDPAQIYDELKEFATASNRNAFAGLEQMERATKLSLKEDLLRQLGGEVTLELDKIQPPEVAWRAILKVKDPDRLQATVNALLAGSPARPRETEHDGITYHILRLPSRDKVMELGYAFLDGYLVLASSTEALGESIQMHRNGGSLAKSARLQASIPQGHSAEASAVFFQDVLAMSTLYMRRFLPQMADSLAQASGDLPPNVAWVYGDDSAVRQFGNSGGSSMSVALIVGAIAIPNLLRARISANEASAAGMVRTLVVAQISYQSTFPMRGFARTLAALGPDPSGANTDTPAHAGLIDSTLGNPACTAGAWCEKSGFRFTMQAACKMARCTDFVVVGTPISTSTGTRNFCATSEGVVRFNVSPPMTAPITVAECRAWVPLQ